MGASVALVAGAVGRQGEALLNRVLGCGDYARVVVLAQAPIALGVGNLEPATLAALPSIDDAFVALSDPDEPASRSFYGRDACFELVHAGGARGDARPGRRRARVRLRSSRFADREAAMSATPAPWVRRKCVAGRGRPRVSR